MKNLKISTRMAATFGVLIALLLAIVATALMQMHSMRANAQTITSNTMPSVELINIMSSNLLRARLLELRHLQSQDPAVMAALEKDMEKLQAQLADEKRRYEPLIITEGERQLFNNFVGERDIYQDLNKQFFALSRQPTEQEAAQALLEGPSLKVFQSSSNILEQLVKFNNDMVKVETRNSSEIYEKAQLVLLSTTVIAILMALFAAIWLTRSIRAPLQQAVETANRVSSGDLSGQIEVTSKDETGLLLAALQRMQSSLEKTVRMVRQNAEGVASASAQIASGNADLSSRTEEQASALEETAASMEELGSTVRQNADNARQANQLALNASNVARRGGDVVSEAVQTMKGINDSSRRIGDIIGVIDGIAFQTNILALNAAVEAARAGEQGRGFAVVAGEVRSLAQRSADAAKEIKALITASMERVEEGSLLVNRAGSTMTEVVTAISQVTDIMGEISAASIEQSSGVAQVGEAVTQMDQATQQNAALVEESAAAAAALRRQAQDLVHAVAVFQLPSNPMDSVANLQHLHQSNAQPTHGASAYTRSNMLHSQERGYSQPSMHSLSRSKAEDFGLHASTRPSAMAGSSSANAARSRRAASADTDDWETF